MQAQPMYHQQQAPSAEYYYDPNHQPHQLHEGYNNAYNNYKTDFNCLNNQPPAPIHPNTDPSMYNGVNPYYYPNPTTGDPYANNATQQQMDYQHSNYHQNYHNSM